MTGREGRGPAAEPAAELTISAGLAQPEIDRQPGGPRRRARPWLKDREHAARDRHTAVPSS